MVYEISYDLNRPGQNYHDLYAEIEKLGDSCHPLDSTWFVYTTLNAGSVRDRLKAVMDKSDSLIVVKASAPGAWSGLSTEDTAWLKKYL